MGRFVWMFLPLFLISAAKAELYVEQPLRTHGYFIGDVLVQRVNLDSSDEPVTAEYLESELRVDDYLYRMESKEITVDKQRWLELRYQIINSPPQTKTIALPAVTFDANGGGEQIMQPWSFTIAPLTSTSPDNVSSPIPDRRALDIIDIRRSEKLKAGIVALIATIALWLLWWVVRHFSDSHTLPFSKANRVIKKLPGNSRDTDPEAWVALHHAFNEVAGKAISNSTVAQLFSVAPWLSKHKNAIEEFYAASSARFYEQSETQSIAVANLCAILYREEKRQKKQQNRVGGRLAH